MEGIFQVLKWRTDGTITDQEFAQIFHEWLRSSRAHFRISDLLEER